MSIVILLVSVVSTALGLIAGVMIGRESLNDRIIALQYDADAGWKFAGKLGDRIGRQRLVIRQLKKQLKSLVDSTPVTMEKPANRPNLPH